YTHYIQDPNGKKANEEGNDSRGSYKDQDNPDKFTYDLKKEHNNIGNSIKKTLAPVLYAVPYFFIVYILHFLGYVLKTFLYFFFDIANIDGFASHSQFLGSSDRFWDQYPQQDVNKYETSPTKDGQ